VSFRVALKSKAGESLGDINDIDPRGHIVMVFLIASSFGQRTMPDLDPYDDHVFWGEPARLLSQDLRQVLESLSPELIEQAKKEQRAHWESCGKLTEGPDGKLVEGFEEWLQLATMEQVRTIVERLLSFSERAANDEQLRMIFQGD
jgi:hypothetical protein